MGHPLPQEVLAHGHRSALTRPIATTDTQIDRLVHELYGLTEGGIEIVVNTRR